MLTSRPLHAIFGTSRAAVLEALLDVEAEFSIRDVARLAGVSPPTASSALAELASQRLVVVRDVGVAMLCRLNPEHFAVEPLRELTRRARDLDGVVRAVLLEEFAPPPVSVIVFGSVARGEAVAGSDLDLLVVAPSEEVAAGWQEHAPGVTARVADRVGRAVQLIVTSPPARTEARSPFWRDLREHGQVLHGVAIEELVRA